MACLGSKTVPVLQKNPSTNPSATPPPVIDLTTPDLPTGVKEIVSKIERALESQVTPTLIPTPSTSQTAQYGVKRRQTAQTMPNDAAGTKWRKSAKGANSVKRIRDKNTEMSTSQ
jgi:hypothetical protein